MSSLIIKDLFEEIEVRTWYLQFNSDLPVIDETVKLEKWGLPEVEPYLQLYKKVGAHWGWSGRLLMGSDELQSLLCSPNNEVWLFKIETELKGFFEITRSGLGEAEIVYLGLFPNEIGKGFGQMLLNAAIAIAGLHGEKVWLHTCELDHPRALVAYLKAGFEVVEEKVELEYYPKNFKQGRANL